MSVKETRAERNIRWINKYCAVPEGKDVGQSLKLRPWQEKEIKKIYDNPNGTRRAIISFGRKNGKTALAACLLLLHLCGPEARRNSQLFSAAQSREQAAILFGLAAKMVRMSPVLNAHVYIKDAVKQLHCKPIGTVYRALSAEASTAYGLSPVFTVHDELGQVRGGRSDLYEALETATGAQENPLSIIISTQAPTDGDFLSVLIDDAMAGHDKRVVLSLYTTPVSDDPFTKKAIRKANPALGDFLNEQEVLEMAEGARRMPSRENQYRNLVLNQRVEASSPLFSRNLWESCGGEVAEFEDYPVYGGLDLSEVNDLTAFVMICKIGTIWNVMPKFWLPGESLRERSQKDRVPYDLWAKEGFLYAAPGKSVDYDYVAEYLFNLFEVLNIEKIAFDRWNFRHLKPCLVRAGFHEEQIEKHFLEFGQGFQSMSPAIRALEAEVLNGRLVHGNHPVLAMCAANACVQMDPAGNRKLNKQKSAGRIDGLQALAMAMGAASSDAPAEEVEYQMLFV